MDKRASGVDSVDVLATNRWRDVGVGAAILREAQDHVGAQRAVRGLLAGVVLEQPANAIALIFARNAVVQPAHACERAARNVGSAEVLLKPDIAAELHADVSAGDVVEAYAVQGADLHVFK